MVQPLPPNTGRNNAFLALAIAGAILIAICCGLEAIGILVHR